MLITDIYDHIGSHFGGLALSVQITMEGKLAVLPENERDAKSMILFGGIQHPISKLITWPLSDIKYFSAKPAIQ